jgi:hypothetical protein
MSCYWGKGDVSILRAHRNVNVMGENGDMATLRVR